VRAILIYSASLPVGRSKQTLHLRGDITIIPVLGSSCRHLLIVSSFLKQYLKISKFYELLIQTQTHRPLTF